jgi:hypothetical protein
MEAVPFGGKALRAIGESSAFKALGPYARQARQAFSKGQIGEVGRELLDNKVVSWVPTSYRGIADRAKGLSDKVGKQIGAIMNELTEGGAKVDREAVADALKARLVKGSEVHGADKGNQYFAEGIEKFRSGQPLSLNDAHAMRKELKGLINWDRLPGADIPTDEKYFRALYSELKSGIDAGAFASGRGEMIEKLGEARKTYGAAKTADNVASGREAREFANRFVSPSDYLVGGLGATYGAASGEGMEDRLKRAALFGSLGLVNKGLRQYGNQVVAKGADSAGALLQKATPIANVAIQSPGIVPLAVGAAQGAGKRSETQGEIISPVPMLGGSGQDTDRKPAKRSTAIERRLRAK